MIIAALVGIIVVTLYFMFTDRREQDEKMSGEGRQQNRVITPRESFTIPVLVYHQIRPYRVSDTATDRTYIMSPEEFAAQLDYFLAHGVTTYAFRDLESILTGGRDFDENSVILSFDDGSRDHYETVFPLLEAYGMKAVFAPFTNALKNQNYLSAEMIREMHEAGHEIASHSVLHPYLTRVDGITQEREIRQSKEMLESIIGDEVQTFVYPFGLHDEAVEELVARSGYQYGRTLEHAYTVTRDQFLTLPGFILTGSIDQLQRILRDEN